MRPADCVGPERISARPRIIATQIPKSHRRLYEPIGMLSRRCDSFRPRAAASSKLITCGLVHHFPIAPKCIASVLGSSWAKANTLLDLGTPGRSHHTPRRDAPKGPYRIPSTERPQWLTTQVKDPLAGHPSALEKRVVSFAPSGTPDVRLGPGGGNHRFRVVFERSTPKPWERKATCHKQ